MSDELHILIRSYSRGETELGDVLALIEQRQWTQADLDAALVCTKKDLINLVQQNQWSDDDIIQKLAGVLDLGDRQVRRYYYEIGDDEDIPMKYSRRILGLTEQAFADLKNAVSPSVRTKSDQLTTPRAGPAVNPNDALHLAAQSFERRATSGSNIGNGIQLVAYSWWHPKLQWRPLNHFGLNAGTLVRSASGEATEIFKPYIEDESLIGDVRRAILATARTTFTGAKDGLEQEKSGSIEVAKLPPKFDDIVQYTWLYEANGVFVFLAGGIGGDMGNRFSLNCEQQLEDGDGSLLGALVELRRAYLRRFPASVAKSSP
jgi:hypothetical protein